MSQPIPETGLMISVSAPGRKAHRALRALSVATALAVFLSAAGCDRRRPEDRFIMRDGQWEKLDPDEPFTGVSVEYWPNGNKRHEVEYRHNKKHKRETRWYENGQKSAVVEFYDGQRHGQWTTWYVDGKKRHEVTYRHGQRHGPGIFWYTNRQRWLEGDYQNGQRHGRWTYWYKNGQKAEEGEFRQGKRHGIWTTWYLTGQKMSESEWRDGEEISHQDWDEEGNLISEE